VTRRRSSARGRHDPARRRSLPWFVLPFLAALIAAGCIGADEARDEPSATPTATAAAPSAEPSVEPTPTTEPTVTPAPTASATPTATAPEASGSSSPSGESGSAAACTGNDSNRTFFAQVAAAVDWPVYCAVLPARWSVDSGQYRLAGGGWMRIAYEGPGGARFELSEGAFCDDADGCVPNGPDAGTAAFGDMTGTLVIGEDGRYAVVVDRGAELSWVAIGVGLDVEVVKDFAADLVRVEG
jgi:hypothetical protein